MPKLSTEKDFLLHVNYKNLNEYEKHKIEAEKAILKMVNAALSTEKFQNFEKKFFKLLCESNEKYLKKGINYHINDCSPEDLMLGNSGNFNGNVYLTIFYKYDMPLCRINLNVFELNNDYPYEHIMGQVIRLENIKV